MGARCASLAFARPAHTPRRIRILGSTNTPGQQRPALDEDHELVARRGVYCCLRPWGPRKAWQVPGVCGLRLCEDGHNPSAQQVCAQLRLKPTGHRLLETECTSSWSAGRRGVNTSADALEPDAPAKSAPSSMAKKPQRRIADARAQAHSRLRRRLSPLA
jgi:hypothetical protein